MTSIPNSLAKRTILLAAILMLPVSAMAYSMSPYSKVGVVKCALPGTTIDFGLNGSGGAVLTELATNYAPFRKAGQTKLWSASIVEQEDKKLLVLDNLQKTRIFVELSSGKGHVFTTPRGDSPILCQILVEP